MKWKQLVVAIAVLSGCGTQKEVLNSKTHLRFIGEYSVPNELQFKGTTVGGLSGIDFDATHNVYYMICDDGSKINPARFYTAKIDISNKGIDSVKFIDVKTLLRPDNSRYPNTGVDPESMRYNSVSKQLFWTSEGERTIKAAGTVLIDPFLHIADLDGKFIDSFSLPSNMHMNIAEKGPRNNGSFEGVAFADENKSVFVSMEEPIYEDGPRAGFGDSTAWIRILKFNMSTKKPVAQYAYRIDGVAHMASPANAFKINGISDILSIGKNKLLVVERSFSTGFPNNTIKLYLSDLSKANDVSVISSLQNQPIKAASKRLLLNMESLGIYIDNIEGVTWGPKLPNGHQSLIFVADNNFSSAQKNQFLLFEVK